MAWARVASATISGTFNTGSVWNAGNLGATPASGNRIILVIGISELFTGSQPTVTGITDDAGHSYARDFLRQKAYASYFAGLEVWSAVANGSAAANITITFNHSLNAIGGAAIAGGAYSGILTTAGAAAAIDLSLGADGTGTSSPADSGTTVGTTAAASELKIGAYVDSGENKLISAGTLDTTYSKWIQTQSTTEQAMLEDADSGSAGSTARATATYTGTSDWQMAVLVYKLAAAAADTQEWMNRSRIDRKQPVQVSY